MTKLYIAYGSNLHKRQMRARCPTARPLGRFYLTDAKLVFRGVADVVYQPGSRVACGLWSINREDERALDRYEGISSDLYFRDESIVLKYAGRKRNALIYLMPSDGIYPPSSGYVASIRQGYRDFNLDESLLNEAIEHSFTEKEPDEQTVARRERQRRDPRHAKLVQMPESVAKRRFEMTHGRD